MIQAQRPLWHCAFLGGKTVDAANEFEEMIAGYQADLDELRKSLRPGDGILGFGRVPGNDPCHARLDEKAAELAKSWAQPDRDRAEAAKLVQLYLSIDKSLTLPPYAQGMLVAIQRHILPLIPRLTREEAGALRTQFEKQYPRFARAPIQKDILRALRQAEEGARQQG